jgi:pilus assembly protein CpaF
LRVIFAKTIVARATPIGRRSWLGEIRGGEAFDLLQLFNIGHSGTLSTVHANSAAQGISRFTTCVLQSGIEMPYAAIKANIAESLNIIVQIERRPGCRFVSEVLEIESYQPEHDRYELRKLYRLSDELTEVTAGVQKAVPSSWRKHD